MGWTTKYDLVQHLCNVRDLNLHFVEQVALAPPEVNIDIAQQEENEKQINQAVQLPLPDADDDDLVDG